MQSNLYVYTLTDRLEKSSTSPLLCKKCSPQDDWTHKFFHHHGVLDELQVSYPHWCSETIQYFNKSPDAVTNDIGFTLATAGILCACDSTSCRTSDTDDLESECQE